MNRCRQDEALGKQKVTCSPRAFENGGSVFFISNAIDSNVTLGNQDEDQMEGESVGAIDINSLT